MRYCLWIIVTGILFTHCTNGDAVTKTPSADSSLEAIDPKGMISDTSQYAFDSTHSDTSSRGLTH